MEIVYFMDQEERDRLAIKLFEELFNDKGTKILRVPGGKRQFINKRILKHSDGIVSFYFGKHAIFLGKMLKEVKVSISDRAYKSISSLISQYENKFGDELLKKAFESSISDVKDLRHSK